MAAASAGFYVLVFIALLNTVISLFYYLMIVKAMYINKADETSVATFRSDNYSRISMVICFAGILVVGIISGIYSYINGIA